jgi:thioredoxin 1
MEHSMEEKRLIHIKDEDFQREVLESKVPVVVDFWAPWCSPCLTAAPVLEKIAEEYQEQLKICKLNVDEERRTAVEYSIVSIPTLIIYKNGEIVDQIIGVGPSFESLLKQKITPHLDKSTGSEHME